MIPDINTLSIDAAKLLIPQCDILRYSGCRELIDPKICDLAQSCADELIPLLTPKAVYAEVPVKFSGNTADFGFCRYQSHSLRVFLGGDCTAAVFAATVGIGADRLISKYSPIIPSRAVMTDGCATAAIECLCDYLCRDVFGTAAQARFSPGYGDLPLEMQRDIISFLRTHLSVGVSMTDSMLLTPTKSVTAIVKIKD